MIKTGRLREQMRTYAQSLDYMADMLANPRMEELARDAAWLLREGARVVRRSEQSAGCDDCGPHKLCHQECKEANHGSK